jgi:hypothetical protein
MRNDFESNYLMHHGILGMKWGHKNGPPYPLDAKDHSSSEKKAGWMKSLADKHKANVKKRKQKKALAKARVARAENLKKEAEKKKYEEEKEKALKSGKASEILKYKGDLTNDQLQKAVGRLDWEKRLNEMSAKEVQTNWDKVDKIMDKVGKVTGYVNKGVDAYNAIERVRKIFEDREKKQKDKIKSDAEESINKIVDSRNLRLIKKYAPLMTNKQLNAALKGLDYQEELDNDYKTEKELKKEANKAAKEEKKEQRRKEKAEERERELEEFYNGPQFIEDDEEEKKKKKGY